MHDAGLRGQSLTKQEQFKMSSWWQRIKPVAGAKSPAQDLLKTGQPARWLAWRRRWLGLDRWRRHELRLAAVLSLLLVLDAWFPPPLPPERGGVIVVASDGTPLRHWPSPDGAWRHPVQLEEISPLYLEAVQGYEDRWFRWHFGVNPLAMIRAAGQWAMQGQVVSGGSTLTMQVARILEPRQLGRDETGAQGRSHALWVKLRQMVRAVQLEMRYSKRELLQIYAQYAPMGGIVEGVEAASRTYFNKPSKYLSRAEAALLAALPQAPSRFRPDRYPERAQAQRDKVLDQLQARGVWTAAEVADAKIETVVVNPIRAQWLAPLAAERLKQAWERERREAAQQAPWRQRWRRLWRSGQGGETRLESTLDTSLQATAERVLLDRASSFPPKVSAAVLVMDNDSLEIKAYAGSIDFNDTSRAAHVDMVRGIRSPGSTLKPFLYAMALDQGLVHSESLLVDAPQAFSGYEPGNFQAAFTGPVSVSEALQRSLNVPAVDLLDRLGPQAFQAQLRSGGVRLRMAKGEAPNLSLILGGAGTQLQELVGAYRALARGGVGGQPRLRPADPRVEARLMSEGSAFIVRDILEIGGHPDRPRIEGNVGLAWKTGTSYGFRDAWAVGVTDRYTLGVWVGRPDGTPNPGHFGANTAAPLLRQLVEALPEPPRRTPLKPPAGVSRVEVCWPSGLKAASDAPENCRQRRVAWALNETVPPTLPDRLAGAWAQGHRLVPDAHGRCGEHARDIPWSEWPAALQAWFPEERLGCEAQEQQARAHGASSRSLAQLEVLGLRTGTVLRRTPGADRATVKLGVRGAQGETLYWLLDGKLVRSGEGDAEWRLDIAEAGTHRLTVMDAHGRSVAVSFEMRP